MTWPLLTMTLFVLVQTDMLPESWISDALRERWSLWHPAVPRPPSLAGKVYLDLLQDPTGLYAVLRTDGVGLTLDDGTFRIVEREDVETAYSSVADVRRGVLRWPLTPWPAVLGAQLELMEGTKPQCLAQIVDLEQRVAFERAYVHVGEIHEMEGPGPKFADDEHYVAAAWHHHLATPVLTAKLMPVSGDCSKANWARPTGLPPVTTTKPCTVTPAMQRFGAKALQRTAAWRQVQRMFVDLFHGRPPVQHWHHLGEFDHQARRWRRRGQSETMLWECKQAPDGQYLLAGVSNGVQHPESDGALYFEGEASGVWWLPGGRLNDAVEREDFDYPSSIDGEWCDLDGDGQWDSFEEYWMPRERPCSG